MLKSDSYEFGLLAGARYLRIEADLEFDTRAPLPAGSRSGSDSGSKWDGIIGMTGQFDLTDTLYLTGYLDGGTGDSDYTWQVAGSVNYRLGRVDLTAGYRYLDYDLGNDAAIADLTIDGPFVGARFRF